jgi:hypothetical protein
MGFERRLEKDGLRPRMRITHNGSSPTVHLSGDVRIGGAEPRLARRRPYVFGLARRVDDVVDEA